MYTSGTVHTWCDAGRMVAPWLVELHGKPTPPTQRSTGRWMGSQPDVRFSGKPYCSSGKPCQDQLSLCVVVGTPPHAALRQITIVLHCSRARPARLQTTRTRRECRGRSETTSMSKSSIPILAQRRSAARVQWPSYTMELVADVPVADLSLTRKPPLRLADLVATINFRLRSKRLPPALTHGPERSHGGSSVQCGRTPLRTLWGERA